MDAQVKEAFDIINKYTGLIQADRLTHIRIQQALGIIEKALLQQNSAAAPAKNPDAPKQPVDNVDKSTA